MSTANLDSLARAYVEAAALEKQYRKQREELRDELENLLDAAGGYTLEGDAFTVTQSLRETRRFDKDAATAAGLDLSPYMFPAVSVVINVKAH